MTKDEYADWVERTKERLREDYYKQETKPAVVTYPRTRRSWYKEAQSFMDWLVVLLLASVLLNVYLAFRVLEASK